MSPDNIALLVSQISLIIALALGFLGIVYQLRVGQRSLRDEMQADREERREQHKELKTLLQQSNEERRAEHKEVVTLLQQSNEERRAEHKEVMALLQKNYEEIQKSNTERRTEHKEAMALLHSIDKNTNIVADRTLREVYAQPRKAQQ